MSGVMRLPASEAVDELVWGIVVGVVWSLGRGSCFRPARLVMKYSHTMPRFAQRAHVGFSLLHLTLETAQASQLSRSLGAAGCVERRDERVCATGEATVAMIK